MQRIRKVGFLVFVGSQLVCATAFADVWGGAVNEIRREASKGAENSESREPAKRAQSKDSSEVSEEAFMTRFTEFKRKIANDARAGFKKACGGVEASGVMQDKMKLILFSQPKPNQKKLFKHYDEPGLEGAFNVYCDGRITGKYANGTAFDIPPMIDDSVQRSSKCEDACRATTAACKRYSSGSYEHSTQCIRPCRVSCQ